MIIVLVTKYYQRIDLGPFNYNSGNLQVSKGTVYIMSYLYLYTVK